jgi:hypothetical protein
MPDRLRRLDSVRSLIAQFDRDHKVRGSEDATDGVGLRFQPRYTEASV